MGRIAYPSFRSDLVHHVELRRSDAVDGTPLAVMSTAPGPLIAPAVSPSTAAAATPVLPLLPSSSVTPPPVPATPRSPGGISVGGLDAGVAETAESAASTEAGSSFDKLPPQALPPPMLAPLQVPVTVTSPPQASFPHMESRRRSLALVTQQQQLQSAAETLGLLLADDAQSSIVIDMVQRRKKIQAAMESTSPDALRNTLYALSTFLMPRTWDESYETEPDGMKQAIFHKLGVAQTVIDAALSVKSARFAAKADVLKSCDSIMYFSVKVCGCVLSPELILTVLCHASKSLYYIVIRAHTCSPR
jgi:hypothetical protein